MKYMGSKRAMLQNGLGTLINREVRSAERFVDLFTGSAAVAAHVARNYSIEVNAYDLQDYSIVLANSVISRTNVLDGEAIWVQWTKEASRCVRSSRIPLHQKLTQKIVRDLRDWCQGQETKVITQSYGGHYFSPLQAMWLDALRDTLPTAPHRRTAALAALIEAASQCAASPGHTAQPFQPTRSAKPFLQEAWDRDILTRVKNSLLTLTKHYAKTSGIAKVENANQAARNLNSRDLVFVDPPYSGVHYSRFYHVLETIARGKCEEVSGVGRYPPASTRPKSEYSVGTQAASALEDLLKVLASRQARVILTFPDHACSNGLSGSKVRAIAKKYFSVSEQKVKSRFSTLGGNGDGKSDNDRRAARQMASELILTLRPE